MMNANRTLITRIIYLVMPSFVVILAAAAVVVSRGGDMPVTYSEVAGYRIGEGLSAEDRRAYIAAFERSMHNARDAESLPRLTRSIALDVVAQAYAEEMAAKRFFDHVSPEGTQPSDRVDIHAPNAIIFGVRENLSYAHSSHPDPVWVRAGRAHEALMDSPGHKINILHREPTHVGIGMASIWRDGLMADYVVQLFGIDAGVWNSGRPRSTTEWQGIRNLPVSLSRSDVEFLLDRPDNPHFLFADPTDRNIWYEGAIELKLSDRSEGLVLSGLSPGTYGIHARVSGRTRGWFRLLTFEVRTAP